MSGAAYKTLGYVVWHVAKWFVRRKVRQAVPPRRVALAGVVAVAIAALVIGAGRRES